MPGGFVFPYELDGLICQLKSVIITFISFILQNLFLHAHNVDFDQTPCSVASDLGLHCLPIPYLWSPGFDGLVHYYSDK